MKTGVFEADFSDLYGRVMGNHHSGDYDLNPTISKDEAQKDLEDARRFVTSVSGWLKQGGWQL